MTTETAIRTYFAAVHGGGWEDFVADDFTSFVSVSFDNVRHGKRAYLEGAGRFFATTTGLELRELVVSGDRVAAFVRYRVRSPKGTPGVCDVAELLTVRDSLLTSSAIFFDAQGLARFMAES